MDKFYLVWLGSVDSTPASLDKFYLDPGIKSFTNDLTRDRGIKSFTNLLAQDQDQEWTSSILSG